MGFPNFNKLMGATVASAIGIESVKILGKTPLFRPLGDLVQEYSNNRSDFIKKASAVAFATGAILYSNQIPSGTVLTAQNQFAHYLTKAYDFIFSGVGTSILGTLILGSHTAYNYAYPPSESLESRIQHLHEAIEKLKRAIEEDSHALNTLALRGSPSDEQAHRASTLGKIEKCITHLRKELQNRDVNGYLPDLRLTLLIEIQILEALNLKFEQVQDLHQRLQRWGQKKYDAEIQHNQDLMVDTLDQQTELLNKQKTMLATLLPKPDKLKDIPEQIIDLTLSANDAILEALNIKISTIQSFVQLKRTNRFNLIMTTTLNTKIGLLAEQKGSTKKALAQLQEKRANALLPFLKHPNDTQSKAIKAFEDSILEIEAEITNTKNEKNNWK